MADIWLAAIGFVTVAMGVAFGIAQLDGWLDRRRDAKRRNMARPKSWKF